MTAKTYDTRIEEDSGLSFHPASGRTSEWTGWRIRYRPLGSRGRWTHFLVTGDRPDTDALVQNLCKAHARGGN